MPLRPIFVLLLGTFFGPTAARAQESLVGLEPAFPGLQFSQPVAIASLPGNSDAVLVIEKGDPAPRSSAEKKKSAAFLGGRVQMISGLSSGKPVKREVFQLAPKDGQFDAAGECGLLGFAVHPKVNVNRQVFAYYSLRIGGKLHQRVSRFLLSSLEPFTVDP